MGSLKHGGLFPLGCHLGLSASLLYPNPPVSDVLQQVSEGTVIVQDAKGKLFSLYLLAFEVIWEHVCAILIVPC